MLNFDRKKAFKAEQAKKKIQLNSLVFFIGWMLLWAREILEQREEKIY